MSRSSSGNRGCVKAIDGVENSRDNVVGVGAWCGGGIRDGDLGVSLAV
jgi:hypothetical protein